MKGSTINEPMTVYHITAFGEDKLWARSIYVDEKMVQAIDVQHEYDNDIPSDAVLLPEGTYGRIKNDMDRFLNEIASFIRNHVIEGNFEVVIGQHYYNGYIYTVNKIDGDRVKCSLFRLEGENISPYWTSDRSLDSIMEKCVPISDKTYNEVLSKYNAFLKELRESLYFTT